MTDEPNPFDELMSQMGVRKLDKPPRGPAKSKGRKKNKKKARHPRGKAAAAPAPSPPPPAQPAPSLVSPPPPAEVEEAPTVKIEPVQTPKERKEASRVREELRSLRAELERARDNLAATREELHRVQSRADELDSHRRSLQRALTRAQEEGQPVSLPPTLSEVLTKRGLKGRDEVRFLFRAVEEARQLHGLVSWLEPTDVEAVERFLDDRVALLGDCEACPKTPGRAIVRVPKERCEICEGSDIKRAVRRFEDACLIFGLRRVVVVGGSPKYHRQLSELVQHHRLQLDLVPGDVRRTQRQADHDLANADVILLWGATLLDHATSDLYKAPGRARVVRIPHRGIGRMLQLAVDALNTDE